MTKKPLFINGFLFTFIALIQPIDEKSLKSDTYHGFQHF
ncbi:hypothetical protein D051_2546 [Vibrio parahaemolyticus VPCR-2010]|nr:hypothetical protein VPBB_A0546 [Vibrio parahaemolyticus BB22OP]EFO45346.1 hypothetical protein VIPARAQ4037_A0556 [Vibrio parahaemolyticus AQ4037]EQL83818.1 hypothetical protein D019_2687 [Vibrio parahaemolyticus VP2007-095]EQM41211.1 hypothetical protein D051_2546 [Vibrio parahaemolyticus VPCR-2010]EXJ46299.1 hypothetical protein D049_1380 [Vibrio parahaemolyticus VPTS-2010]